ncbi:MAG: hypothetical protein GX049_06625 [Alcaligenaceae bacterium]|nr:hypothetical protein [Alcaligenaceae bacterium]
MAQKTFRQAYQVLQDHAETLRNQQEPNIDDLLTIVNESVAAYKVCRQRIDAVEKALEQALNGAGVDAADVHTTERGKQRTAAGSDEPAFRGAFHDDTDSAGDPENDIPF